MTYSYEVFPLARFVRSWAFSGDMTQQKVGTGTENWVQNIDIKNANIIRFISDGVFEILAYIFCILLMDRIGRRIILTFLLLLAGVGLILSVIVNEYAGENQCKFI